LGFKCKTTFCITVDEQSLKDKSVTIRERDSMKQIRINIKELRGIMRKLVNDEISFEEAGESV